MAERPDWGKSGAIAGWCAIAVVIVITVIAYIRPPDPAHPVKLDFLYSQISISIPLWVLVLIVVGLVAAGTKIYRVATRPPVEPDPIQPPPITPLSPEFFALENDHNELKKRFLESQQSLQRSTEECASLRSQLETPKIAISIKSSEVFEETDNHRILIRVVLKIYNEHRVATKIQSIRLEVRGTPSGRIEHSCIPAQFPQQTIEFGFPVESSVDFWIGHLDGQSIVKNYFTVTVTDGADQTAETQPQLIPRFTILKPTVDPESNSPRHIFAFDPKIDSFRLNSDEMIALELVKSASGMLGFTVAPVNTTPKVIESYQVEVAEANSWSEKHQQFVECVGFNRKLAVRGGKLAPQSKDNGQWLIRVVGKEGQQVLTVYNDDSTPLRWPNDDPTDIETWRLTLVTASSDAPDFRRGKVVAMSPRDLVVRWDKKHSTLLAAPYEKPPETKVKLNLDPPGSLSTAEGAVVEWLRRIHFQGKVGFQTEYPGLVAITPEGDKIGYLIASTADGMEKLIQQTDLNRYDDLRRLYIVMTSEENREITAAARSMLTRKLPARVSVTIGHMTNGSFGADEEHPPPAQWRSA